MTELLLGVRLIPFKKMNIIKMNDVNLKETVEKLKNEAAGKINLPNNSFDFIYCGCLLENNCTLESYGVKNGSMIHILNKKENVGKKKSTTITAVSEESNVGMLTSVFKSFIGNPLLELAMRRLTKRPEVIENIISSSPGLSEDAVAIAILQDPDLIIHFTDAETMKRIARLHPALLEAAQHIASAVHDEAHSFAASTASITASTSNAPTTGHSYSLENFSDDEEMAGDSSQSSDSTQPSSSTNQSRNPSDTTINAQLLAAAISRAQRSTSAGSFNNDSSSSFQPNPNSGGVITFEMFNQAIQQAFASRQTDGVNSSQSSSSSASIATPQSTTTNNDMQRQITIMHEMGLQNDAINLQALQITNGDVQAAIDLVLNGLGDN